MTAGRSSQSAGLLVVAHKPAAQAAQVAGLVVYAPSQTRNGRTSQAAALVPYSITPFVVPRTAQLVGMAVYGVGVPAQSMSTAWTFTLDGHTFYVLNLGPQGTWLYDMVTQEWCEFETDGYGQWNMLNGCMWGQRIVAGDSISQQVWELDPSAVLDQGWKGINHAVTGGLDVRSRTYYSLDAVRITASVGLLDEVNGATIALSWSDDQGQTYTDPADFTLDLMEGDSMAEVAWRSLGSFAAPGRVFQITDVGGLIRIDGCDAFINDFDEDVPQQQQAGGKQ